MQQTEQTPNFCSDLVHETPKMGNEIATKHPKSNIDQFPQIHSLSPQDDFSTKHPQSPQNFPPNHLLTKSPPNRNPPNPSNHLPSCSRPQLGLHAPLSINTQRTLAVCPRCQSPPAPAAFCPTKFLPHRAGDVRPVGLGKRQPSGYSHPPLSGRSRHPYRAGAATPIGQEAAQL